MIKEGLFLKNLTFRKIDLDQPILPKLNIGMRLISKQGSTDNGHTSGRSSLSRTTIKSIPHYSEGDLAACKFYIVKMHIFLQFFIGLYFKQILKILIKENRNK